MKALTFHGKRTIRYENVEDPRLELASDVIVKVTASAICGSDLHVYHERERGVAMGTTMGHEFMGEIVERGDGVKTLSVGDAVVAPFTTNCGDCFYCRQGLTARCVSGELFGWVENGEGLQGAQAEYVRVPMADATLVRLQENEITSESLLLGDILSTALFCTEMADVRAGGNYAVVGCGPVGILAVIACLEKGAKRVFAFDTVDERLALVNSLGADAVNILKGPASESVKQETEGRGVDAALELVGSPEASRLAMDLVRPGGTIAAAGVHTEAQFAFSPAEAYDKNITYRAGRCSARHYMERARTLLEKRRAQIQSVVTHEMPLSEGVEGYGLFDNKRDGCIKVVLHAPS